MLCYLSNVNRCFRRTVEGRNCNRSSRFLLPSTHATCGYSSVGPASGKSEHSESVSLSISSHEARLSFCNEVIQLRTSRLSLLITSYKLLNGRVERVWGSLSGTIGRASHSRISHKGCMEHMQRKWKRIASLFVNSLST